MASLTQTAIVTRKIIRFGIYAVILLIVGRILFNIGAGVYRRFFPEPPPPPTVSFGRLTEIPSPEKERPSLTFTLETAEGGLPIIPSQAKVYFMPSLSASLLSLDVAKEKAGALGFSPAEQKISETIYRFINEKVPSTLEMNIATGIFSLSYDLASDPSPLERRPPPAEVAASQVRSYLSGANLLPDDLTGPTSHEFLKIEEGSLVSVVSLSEADLVKVNLFRKPYDELPSLTPNPNEANVWFLVSGERARNKQVVGGEFHYFPVNEDQFATYPIKTAQAAWDELNQGGGYIANLGENPEGNVVIRDIYLAYFDPGVPVEFYQPVFVFQGDRNFTAYVPAVTLDYYGE